MMTQNQLLIILVNNPDVPEFGSFLVTLSIGVTEFWLPSVFTGFEGFNTDFVVSSFIKDTCAFELSVAADESSAYTTASGAVANPKLVNPAKPKIFLLIIILPFFFSHFL